MSDNSVMNEYKAEVVEALTWLVYEALMVVGGVRLGVKIKDVRLRNQAMLVKLSGRVAKRLYRHVRVSRGLLVEQRKGREYRWRLSATRLWAERNRRLRQVAEGLSWPENLISSIGHTSDTSRR